MRRVPDRPEWHVRHETIYQALYERRLEQGTHPPAEHRVAPAAAPTAGARPPGAVLAPAQLIDARPLVVEDRRRVRDWEGDLIAGRMSRSAIGTLVDRRSRYLRLVHLPDGHSADRGRHALEPVLASPPAAALLTLRCDQGSEMAHPDRLADLFADGIFFAHPGSPWLRGTNGNTNGLLRQYFPKGGDLRGFSPNDLRDVEQRLNHWPRKITGCWTPAQVSASAVAP